MHSRELYIYEIINTIAYEAKLLEIHIERINHAALNLFNIKHALEESRIKEEIFSLLSKQRLSQEVSIYLRLELYEDGSHSLSIEQVSIYEGYMLRCFEPKAIISQTELPYQEFATGASEQMAHMERIEAQRAGGDLTLRCCSTGEIIAANSAPLFAVVNGVIHHNQGGVSSAESAFIIAAVGCQFEIVDTAIIASKLDIYDELFYTDHYGVTAIKYVNNRIYMNTIASRVAALMSEMSY